MDFTKMSDKQLISAYISGKELALNKLIERHQSKVFGYIMVSVKDEDIANDIFQDAFIKVVNKIKSGEYSEQGKFIQWVMRITHNLIIDFYRKNSKVYMVRDTDEYDVLSNLPLHEDNMEDEIIKKQTYDKLRSLIEYLPENQKEVLMMRHYSDMSFKDIAESNEISINTALGRMRYALINLRKLMEENSISLY
jgi:RNA polymerase sigma-70 factor (ECF subfamily)